MTLLYNFNDYEGRFSDRKNQPIFTTKFNAVLSQIHSFEQPITPLYFLLSRLTLCIQIKLTFNNYITTSNIKNTFS